MRQIVLVLLLLLCECVFQASSQYYNIKQSDPQLSPNSADDTVYGTQLDSQNNIYIVGSTEGSLYGTWNDTSTTPRTTDLFVAKFIAVPNNSTLNKMWARQISSQVVDGGYGVALSPSEDYLYICGTYANNAWIGKLSSDTGASLVNYSYTAPNNGYGYYPRFSSVAVTSSDVYAVGYYYQNSTASWDSFAMKLYATNLTVQWTRTWSTSSEENLNTVAFQDSSSRLFVAGSSSRPGLDKQFWLLELASTNGSTLFETTWPDACGATPDYITDIAVGNSYLYYIGISSTEYTSSGTPSGVCADEYSTSTVVGSLSLSNLSNHQWIYNLSKISTENCFVEGNAISLGSNGLLFFGGSSTCDTLYGQNSLGSLYGYPDSFYDWFLGILRSSTGSFYSFSYQGVNDDSNAAFVDDKVYSISVQTSNGAYSTTNNYGVGGKNDFIVTYAKNSTDPSPSPAPSQTPTIPSMSPSRSPSPSVGFATSVTSSVTPDLTPRAAKSKDNKAAIGAGVAVAAVAVIALSAVLIVFLRRRKTQPEQIMNSELPLENQGAPSGTNYWTTPVAEDDTYSPIHVDRDSLNELQTKTGFLEVKYKDLTLGPKLGEGAYGIVFKGNWRGSNVAIKRVHDNVTEDQISDFMKEAALMQKIRPHTNVVQFLGISTSPLVIVTEFLERGSLYDYLQTNEGRNMSKEQERELMKGIASGMYHLASEGIVHRDLAARNILLSGTLVPKISDFGMSRLVAHESGSVTQSTVGPLKWMAPENILYRAYSEKSDVWSFGILCIEIITKQDPYPGMDGVQVASQIGFQQLKPEIPSNSSEEIQNLLKACFEFTPNDRPDFRSIFQKLLK